MEQISPGTPRREAHPHLVPPEVAAQRANAVGSAAAGAKRSGQPARQAHQPACQQWGERMCESVGVHRGAAAPQPRDREIERDARARHPARALSARAVPLVTDPASQ